MIPLEAAKRAGNASNTALTGDIYTRRWATKKGKTVTEHELRVNPVSIGIGAAAVGVAALFGGVALWATQQKIGKAAGKDVRVEYVITLDKNGDPTRYTYYLGSVPFKTSTTGVPWDALLPAYYQKRGYAPTNAVQTSATASSVKGYMIYKTTQERYGIQERKGFGINIGL